MSTTLINQLVTALKAMESHADGYRVTAGVPFDARAMCKAALDAAALAAGVAAAPGEMPPIQLDPVVEANRAMLHERSQVGIKKYGVTLGEAQWPRRVLLQHALEEALDLSNYLQAEIQRTDAATPPLCPECQAREAGEAKGGAL